MRLFLWFSNTVTLFFQLKISKQSSSVKLRPSGLAITFAPEDPRKKSRRTQIDDYRSCQSGFGRKSRFEKRRNWLTFINVFRQNVSTFLTPINIQSALHTVFTQSSNWVTDSLDPSTILCSNDPSGSSPRMSKDSFKCFNPNLRSDFNTSGLTPHVGPLCKFL